MLERQHLFLLLPSRGSLPVAGSHGPAKLMDLCFLREHDSQSRNHQEVIDALLPHVLKPNLYSINPQLPVVISREETASNLSREQ